MNQLRAQVSRQQGQLLVMVFALGLFFALVLFVLIPSLAPPTSQVNVTCIANEDGACLQLPQVSGINLDGATITLPDDFTNAINLVVMPFDQAQQEAALDWVPFFAELTQANDDTGYYNLAALPNLAPAVRLLVQTGMSIAVDDEAVRQVTVISYLQDQQAFIEALGIPDTDAMQVFALTATGDILWQGRGIYDETLADALRQTLASMP